MGQQANWHQQWRALLAAGRRWSSPCPNRTGGAECLGESAETLARLLVVTLERGLDLGAWL